MKNTLKENFRSLEMKKINKNRSEFFTRSVTKKHIAKSIGSSLRHMSLPSIKISRKKSDSSDDDKVAPVINKDNIKTKLTVDKRDLFQDKYD